MQPALVRLSFPALRGPHFSAGLAFRDHGHSFPVTKRTTSGVRRTSNRRISAPLLSPHLFEPPSPFPPLAPPSPPHPCPKPTQGVEYNDSSARRPYTSVRSPRRRPCAPITSVPSSTPLLLAQPLLPPCPRCTTNSRTHIPRRPCRDGLGTSPRGRGVKMRRHVETCMPRRREWEGRRRPG